MGNVTKCVVYVTVDITRCLEATHLERGKRWEWKEQAAINVLLKDEMEIVEKGRKIRWREESKESKK